jgi:hypothetical protein
LQVEPLLKLNGSLSINLDEVFGGAAMKFRVVTGGAMLALGVCLWIGVLGFINGPVLYLLPFAYPIEAIRLNGLAIGTSSFLIGIVVIGSIWFGKASAK